MGAKAGDCFIIEPAWMAEFDSAGGLAVERCEKGIEARKVYLEIGRQLKKERALGGTFVTIEPTATIDNPAKLKRYREMIEYTFDSIGFERRKFFCFRIRVPMPPLGMTVTLAAGEIPSRNS